MTPMPEMLVETEDNTKRRKLIVSLILVAICAGCGESRPPKYLVTGRLRVNGEDAVGAMLTLYPKDAGSRSNLAPSAMVRPDGSFSFGTSRANDGVPPGEYDLTFVWPIDPSLGAMSPDRLEKVYASPQKPLKSIIVGEEALDLSTLEVINAKVNLKPRDDRPKGAPKVVLPVRPVRG